MHNMPELQIKPWEALIKDLEEGNQRVKWIDRIPYAYWKGNPRVSLVRKELLKCNLTDQQDWGAVVYGLTTTRPKTLIQESHNYGKHENRFGRGGHEPVDLAILMHLLGSS
ncbi:hypothetical protein CsSME_00023945 [Camellia sinensis var. sinensis]